LRLIHLLPQTKAPYECIAVVANPAFWRQVFKFLGIATSQNHFVGFERGREPDDHIRDMLAPPLLSLP